jgi:PRTRC genetic system ThiF family protein
MTVHYVHPYFLNPPHKITVDLVGLGGTGSIVLTNLARMNEALTGLGHPGLHVRAWDNDIVSSSNMGRQLFSPADLDQNKASVLITRVNRFFGYEWQAVPRLYIGKETSNITITCVDTAKARIDIHKKIYFSPSALSTHTDKPYYWLDIGNLQTTGQVILGTLVKIGQPKSEHKRKFVVPTVIEKFPQIKRIKEKDQGPSCSLAEALEKQDLFINSTLAQFGCNILWKLIREGMIKYHGCYVNLETLSVNPIKISA